MCEVGCKYTSFMNSGSVIGISLAFPENAVTALIGPSGCGKSTLLRALNRMNDRIPDAEISGRVLINGQDIYDRRVNLTRLRREVGMVFQKPNPFPMSIFENVALGPRLHYGIRGRALQEVVEDALRKAALWDEVKDDLNKSGLALSGGQQQRLCIARMLAVQPRILLMDEPCSALDPISTQKIEELIIELGKRYTVIVVTHNLQQAARISHYTGFLMYGEVVEWGETVELFARPKHSETEDYIRGRFG